MYSLIETQKIDIAQARAHFIRTSIAGPLYSGTSNIYATQINYAWVNSLFDNNEAYTHNGDIKGCCFLVR